jgi:hypothetical protein
MIAGTHLRLDLTTYRCVLIKTADQCPMSWYYPLEERTKKPVLAASAILQCECGVTTQIWERRTLEQDVDAFVEDAQMLVSKY